MYSAIPAAINTVKLSTLAFSLVSDTQCRIDSFSSQQKTSCESVYITGGPEGNPYFVYLQKGYQNHP